MFFIFDCRIHIHVCNIEGKERHGNLRSTCSWLCNPWWYFYHARGLDTFFNLFALRRRKFRYLTNIGFGSYPKQISRYALIIHMGILDYKSHITVFSWLVFSPFADSQWPFIHPSPLSVLFFKPMYHSNSLPFRISLLIKFHSSSVSMEIRSPLHPSQRPLLYPMLI